MQEIITVKGQQYNIESTNKLTTEQRNEVIKQLSVQTSGCSSCGQSANNKISTLASGCPGTIAVGTVKTFRVDSATGVSPFVFTLVIGGTKQTPSSPYSGSFPYTLQNYTFNTAGTFSVAVEVTDACGDKSKTGSDSCINSVVVETRRLASMNKPTCASYTINVDGTTQATVGAGKDQFGDPFTPTNVTWSSSNTSVVTVTLNGGVVTGAGAGTATITATSGTIISPVSDTITVSVVCTTPTCSFTII